MGFQHSQSLLATGVNQQSGNQESGTGDHTENTGNQQPEHTCDAGEEQNRAENGQQVTLAGKDFVEFGIPGGSFLRLLSGHPPERQGRCRRLGRLGQHPGFYIKILLGLGEFAKLVERLLCIRPGGEILTGGIRGGFFFQSGIHSLLGIGNALGIRLRGGVGKGAAMVFQLGKPLLHLGQSLPLLLGEGFQVLQLPEFGGKLIPLGFRLGEQAGTVVADAVFQFFQFFCQFFAVAGFVTGGDKGVQPGAEGIIGGDGHIAVANEGRAEEDIALDAQEFFAAICSGEFRYGKTGLGLVGLKIAQRDTALGAALDGDIPAVPMEVDPAGHGTAGPGKVVFLVSQSGFGGLGTGVHAVEHGGEEGAPSAFAPLIGCFDDVQPRLEGQGLVL